MQVLLGISTNVTVKNEPNSTLKFCSIKWIEQKNTPFLGRTELKNEFRF